MIDVSDDRLTFTVRHGEGDIEVDTFAVYLGHIDRGALDIDGNFKGTEAELVEVFRELAGLPASLTTGQVVRVRAHWLTEVEAAQKKMYAGPNSPDGTGLTQSRPT